MATNIMSLYNDSDSDSDTEFFTSKHKESLLRNQGHFYGDGIYEEEHEMPEFDVVKRLVAYNKGHLTMDDDLSVGSDYELPTPKRFPKATDMDEVDSDNDFEPYMRGRKLVLATDDSIEDYLDGNAHAEELDSAYTEPAGMTLAEAHQARQFREGKSRLVEAGDDETGHEVHEKEVKHEDAKKSLKNLKAKAESRAKVSSTLAALKAAKGKPAPAMKSTPEFKSAEIEAREFVDSILNEAAREAAPLVQAKKRDERVNAQLFKHGELEEVPVGDKGYHALMFRGQKVLASSMDVATMKEALNVAESMTPSKTKKITVAKIKRAISGGVKKAKVFEAKGAAKGEAEGEAEGAAKPRARRVIKLKKKEGEE